MDEEFILFELQMMIICIKWSLDGDVFGVVGLDVLMNVKVLSFIVQFFFYIGVYL